MTSRIDLKLVKRSSASRLVAEQILEHIHRGTLKSGDQLPTEKELMQQLGVGRSSVREGLQILATLSLIDSRPRTRTFVRIPPPNEHLRPELLRTLIANAPALELLEARQMIEPSAVRLACIRATGEELDRVDALLDEHAQLLKRGNPVHEQAARFHVMLAEASHNQIAAQFMRSIMKLLMVRGRKIDRIPGYAEEEVVEHRAIAQLVRSRDPDAASTAMAAHIIRSAQTYDAELTAATSQSRSKKVRTSRESGR